ncbi:MAG: hypothetical protein ACYC59_01020 [Anaerolineaceae bacterium]
MSDFQGFSTNTVSNNALRLEYLVNAGPRIVRLFAFGKENLFAEITDKKSTIYGDYSFRGGHRLWHSPEATPRTYIPDNNGVTVENIPDGAILRGSTEEGTGIAKTIKLQVSPDQPKVILTHTLTNQSLWPVKLAPWTVTMFKLGGTIIIPLQTGNRDAEGLLHNRIIAIWPYTHITDPRLTFQDNFITIHAVSTPDSIKIGSYCTAGWIAYWIDGVLFKKSFDTIPEAFYPDGGCNTESYCGTNFAELEALGPMVTLNVGESAVFSEKWELFPNLDVPFLSTEIKDALIAKINE